MKKKGLIVGLAIGGGFGVYTFVKHTKERKQADQKFLNYIKEVCDSLRVDYNDMHERDRSYYYNKIASNLYKASQIKPKTSYKKVENEDIDSQSALYTLHIHISINNERRDKVVLERGEDLVKALENLSTNPKDKKNWTELSKLVDEIGRNNVDELESDSIE